MVLKPQEMFLYIKKKRDWRECQSKNKKLSVEWDTFIKDNHRYVVFQETTGTQDWIQNFSFTKRKYGDYKFHHGFYELYDLMRDELIAIIKNEQSDYPIIVSGWSQGAALAEIAVQDIYYHTGRKCVLVSFGVPMALYGKKTRDAVRNSCIAIYEYCNNNDVVTYQPPFPGWYHARRVDVGDHFNLLKILKPTTYHTNYNETVPETIII